MAPTAAYRRVRAFSHFVTCPILGQSFSGAPRRARLSSAMIFTVRIAVADSSGPTTEVLALGVPDTGLNPEQPGLPADAVAALRRYGAHRPASETFARPGTTSRAVVRVDVSFSAIPGRGVS